MSKVNFNIAVQVGLLLLLVSCSRSQDRVAVYKIACDPSPTGDYCAFVSGAVQESVADTARSCSVSLPYCQTKYGAYGLGIIRKTKVQNGGNDGYAPSFLVSTPGTYIKFISVHSTEDRHYIVWSEEQGQTNSKIADAVMFVSKKIADNHAHWSDPDTLFTSPVRDFVGFDVAVEQGSPQVSSASGDLHVMITHSKRGGLQRKSQHLVLHDGLVESRTDVEINNMAYPQIVASGDSIHLAFVGLIASQMKEEDITPRSGDRNNVFVSSMHRDSTRWEKIRLVEDTGRMFAHYLAASANGDTAHLGYVIKNDSGDYGKYRHAYLDNISKRRTYQLKPFVGVGMRVRMIRNEKTVLVEDPGPAYTVLHTLTPADTTRYTKRVEGQVMSSTYYKDRKNLQYTYIKVCASRGVVTCVLTVPVTSMH